jgi:hypothetical protein
MALGAMTGISPVFKMDNSLLSLSVPPVFVLTNVQSFCESMVILNPAEFFATTTYTFLSCIQFLERV